MEKMIDNLIMQHQKLAETAALQEVIANSKQLMQFLHLYYKAK